MAEWIDVGPAHATAAGNWLTGEVEGIPLAVVRVAGVLYAFEDRCTHDGESLAGAELEDLEVICPRHGARFSLTSGAAMSPPAYEPVRVFAVREESGRILVQAPE
jgi:3-phenylpropionate/trans-cinnamate dioxygenase ferredoxin subunit